MIPYLEILFVAFSELVDELYLLLDIKTELLQAQLAYVPCVIVCAGLVNYKPRQLVDTWADFLRNNDRAEVLHGFFIQLVKFHQSQIYLRFIGWDGYYIVPIRLRELLKGYLVWFKVHSGHFVL